MLLAPLDKKQALHHQAGSDHRCVGDTREGVGWKSEKPWHESPNLGLEQFDASDRPCHRTHATDPMATYMG